MSDFNAKIIDEFRANDGNLSGNFAGAPMLLLTTTGAKSGKSRTNPLVYLVDGDRYVIFASKAGAPTNPDWYHNLMAHPRVKIEIGDETFDADATVVEGEERERLFSQQTTIMPGFGEYQEKAGGRTIPVVALSRA